MQIRPMLFIACVWLATPASAQTLVDSFERLRAVLTPGQTILVMDRDGHKQRGELVVNTGQEITIKWRDAFFRSRQRAFVESRVTQVEVSDSPWEGAVIGAGAGMAVSLWIVYGTDRSSALPVAFLAPIVGPFLGGTVDLRMNRVVYTSPAAGTVTFVPVVGRGRVGGAAQIRF
jgi:hypothetical protein